MLVEVSKYMLTSTCCHSVVSPDRMFRTLAIPSHRYPMSFKYSFLPITRLVWEIQIVPLTGARMKMHALGLRPLS